MDDAVGVMRNPNVLLQAVAVVLNACAVDWEAPYSGIQVIGETLSFADLMRRDFWGLPMHGLDSETPEIPFAYTA